MAIRCLAYNDSSFILVGLYTLSAIVMQWSTSSLNSVHSADYRIASIFLLYWTGCARCSKYRPVILQGAATWRIYRHDPRVIAGLF